MPVMSEEFADTYCWISAMSPTEVTEKLGLMRMKDRSWFCHPSNALAGDGLFEGSSNECCGSS